MNARKFGGIVVVVLALVAVAGFAQQDEMKGMKMGGQKKDMKMEDHMEHNAMMQECAKACSDCQRACDSCATHCAHMLSDGMKEHLTTLMTCRDCATICSACAEVCSRGGPFSVLIVEACAKACADCATACDKFPADTYMKACAEECRRCEKACRAMMKQMPGK